MKVVIVGAGVAGLSIGWRLAQSGVEVVILERAEPARGATWAAAGMIAPTAETEHADAHEIAFARLSADLWPAFAQEIESKTGRKIGYKRDGALIVAMTADERTLLAKRNASAILSAADACLREPSLAANIAGAVWDENEAQVDNRALGDALIAACISSGVKVVPTEAVLRIVSHNGALTVQTPFAYHHADKVIVAAGAWSGEIEMPEALPVRPVKGEMIALAPPDASSLPNHVIWGNGVYLVPRKDRLFVGATVAEAGFNTSTTKTGRDWLRARAIGLMPSLADWIEDEHWAGLRPGTPDNMPILGETRTPNLFFATGQFRNGIMFAPAIANAMCAAVLGNPSQDIEHFSPQRFGG